MSVREMSSSGGRIGRRFDQIGDRFAVNNDRAYANGAFIPGAEDYAPRWSARAAVFRGMLGHRAQVGMAYGPGERHRFDLFLPEGDAARRRDLRSRRVLDGVRPRKLVASGGRAAGAGLGGGDAVLHAGAAGADRRDHARDRDGAGCSRQARGGADGGHRSFGGRASDCADGLRRCRPASGVARAAGAGRADLAAGRPGAAAPDQDERDAEAGCGRGDGRKPDQPQAARRAAA